MQAHSTARQHLCSELVSVVRLAGRRCLKALDGNLEEIGEWSALILMQDAVPTGTKVRVMSKGHELRGSVKSCTIDRLLGFFIEVELELESRWSEKWFVPQHLFALCPTLRYFTKPTRKVPEEIPLTKSLQMYRPDSTSHALRA
jgi:hypothetical protein